MLEVNLNAVWDLSQRAARVMIAQESGKIINIASMISFFGGIRIPAYAASKGGVAQLTKALAVGLAKYNIQVNALAPGYMDTEMNTALLQDSQRCASILSAHPCRTVWPATGIWRDHASFWRARCPITSTGRSFLWTAHISSASVGGKESRKKGNWRSVGRTSAARRKCGRGRRARPGSKRARAMAKAV